MTQRSDQVAGLLRDAVQKVIAKGLHDPRVRGLITVTRVTISDDLRTATAYISVMPDQHRELTMHGLRAAAKHIRHEISDELALRRIPDLMFKPDAAAARQAAVLDALAKVATEPEPRPAQWGVPEQASPTHSANNPTPEGPTEPDQNASDDR